jgi:hypothetical protein
VSDDGLQIVKTRLLFERRADAVAGGDELRRIAGPQARPRAGYALHGLDHVQHGKTTLITTIEGRGGVATAQISERIGVGDDEIGNVNIITDAGTVRFRVVGSEHIHFRPQTERSLDRDLDEMGGCSGRLAGATERVGACDVEIAQDYMSQPMRRLFL